ncbi:MAG: alpha/beta fold hydrolase [Methylobacteriaceae bacterium]|nr:alpha/beta fold hydrolase [Methylobacteriaceae bacterium]
MSPDLDWAREGRDWPNRDSSRFVRAAGLSWHVQVLGEGPTLLLAHGTAAATHSWRGLAPQLARHFQVIAPDLPGHGFTARPPSRRQSLDGMAADLAELVRTLGSPPEIAVGHSAGVAILCRMALAGDIDPRAIVSLNGALLAFRGAAGQVFSPLAKLLAANPLTANLVSWFSSRRSVERLIAETGSQLDRTGIELYERVVSSPSHVGAALEMMANWDLDALERELPTLKVPLVQLVGSNDRAIPPSAAEKVRRLVPSATIVMQKGLGHLAHEERPAETAAEIVAVARRVGVLPPAPEDVPVSAAESRPPADDAP